MPRPLGEKGITPVIAIILLMIIAVAAATLTYIWVVGYVQTSLPSSSIALGERLKFEAASLRKNTQWTFTGVVRNIGDTSITIDAAYLLDGDGKTFVAEASGFSSVTLDPGEAKTITADFGTSGVEAGRVYVVKVVTTQGTEAAVKVKART